MGEVSGGQKIHASDEDFFFLFFLFSLLIDRPDYAAPILSWSKFFTWKILFTKRSEYFRLSLYFSRLLRKLIINRRVKLEVRRSTLLADVELECLATWKESSTHNLVARLHAPRKTSDEDSYRCFIYEQTSNNSWNLAQSEDASCTGLISVKEAAKTFKMKQSEYLRTNAHQKSLCPTITRSLAQDSSLLKQKLKQFQ